MSTRGPGRTVLVGVLAVAGVLAGAVGGSLLAGVLDEEPRTLSTADPVPAVSPSYPMNPPPVVEEDPDTPGMAVDLPSHPEVVGAAPFQLRLPIPDGWTRSASTAGEWKWFPPDQPGDNAFFLRVRVFSGTTALGSAVRDRLEALESASEVEDLVVEDPGPDRFVASYVFARHRRVDMERFLSFDGGTTAFAVIAVLGRERDRLGMADLLERIARGATRV